MLKFVDEDRALLKPDYENSICGIFPSLLKMMGVSNELLPDSLLFNKNIEELVKEKFPSGFNDVVIFFVDSLSIEHIERTSSGFLKEKLETQGTQIHSVFPTMTSTAVVSISYGKSPSEHGYLGYEFYNENLDGLFNALNLLFMKDGTPLNSLDYVEVQDLVQGTPLFEVLRQNSESLETPITLFQSVNERSSEVGIRHILYPNTDPSSYDSIDEGIMQLVRQLGSPGSNRILSMYIPDTDSVAHTYGPESTQYQYVVRELEMGLRHFCGHPKVKSGETLVALISDHGQSQIYDRKVLSKKDISKLAGKGIRFGNSGRAIHVYLDDYSRESSLETVQGLVGNKGVVLDTDQAFSLSGGEPSNPDFRKRMGDYVILLEDHFALEMPQQIPYGEIGELVGNHGSLTEKELVVPFLILN